MLSSNSAIATVNKMDVFNFDGISKQLQSAALLPDDVERLYVMLYEVISGHLATREARTAGALFVLCRKHLVLGTTSLFRLYSAQTFRETRAAVEAAGIAHAIQTDPNSFKVLSEDDGSEAARKLARKTFSSKLLFPAAIPQLKLLFDFYDTASRLSHTSGLTFVRHLTRHAGTGEIGFTYQDIQRENLDRDLPHHLFWLCQAHIAILMAADVVFSAVNADLSNFKQARIDVFERLNRFKRAHDAKIGAPNVTS